MLKFYDGTKTQSYRVNSKTTYILNGKLLNGNEIANVFKTNQGTYKLIDNNADDTYDLVILNTPTVYSPSAIDKEREIIVDPECGELDLSKFSSYMRITQGTVKRVDGNYAMLDTMQNKINLTEFVDISTAKIIKFNLKKGKYEQYDKGYLSPDDEYIGILKMGKMMMFIIYER